MFDTAEHAVASVLFWLTVALAIAFLSLLFAFKAEKRKKFLKVSLWVAVVYALGLAIYFFTAEILKVHAKGRVLGNLIIPLSFSALFVAISALLPVFKRNKITYVISGALVAAGLIWTLISIGLYFSGGLAEFTDINKAVIKSSFFIFSPYNFAN